MLRGEDDLGADLGEVCDIGVIARVLACHGLVAQLGFLYALYGELYLFARGRRIAASVSTSPSWRRACRAAAVAAVAVLPVVKPVFSGKKSGRGARQPYAGLRGRRHTRSARGVQGG